MVEFYDPSTGLASKPPPPTKAEITRKAWEDTLVELKAETNIPTIGYSYFDTKNEFEVRLRGTKDQYMRTEYGEMRFLQRGIYPRLHKNFNFKGEGKSPYASRDEIEKWQSAIMKWFKSLDGQRELAEAEMSEPALEIPQWPGNPNPRSPNQSRAAAAAPTDAKQVA